LEPEVDENFINNEEQTRNYFTGAAEDIDEIIKNHADDCEDDDNSATEDLSPYEKRARKMKNVLPDGGVKKRTLNEGIESGGLVPDMATVTIHYSLSLEEQDEPFDSTYLRGRPERYRLDEGQLLPGLEIAIKSMKMSEKAEFLIEPHCAFGTMGCPPRSLLHSITFVG
jgi:FK506-binding protein 6